MILAEGARRYFFHRHVTAYIDLLYLDCQTKRAHWSTLSFPRSQQIRSLRAPTPHLLRELYAKVRHAILFLVHEQNAARANLAIQQAEKRSPAFDSKEVKHRSSIRAEALPETIHLTPQVSTKQATFNISRRFNRPWLCTSSLGQRS